MSSRRLRAGALAMLCAAASAAPAAAQTRSPAAEARAGIEAALARLDSVSRAGDAAGNADLFTADAVVSMGTVADVRGRDTLRVLMTGFYERNVVQVHRLQVRELEAYGDTAYARGTYLWVAGARGQPAKTERGRFSAVWHRSADGRWRMYRYLENLLPDAGEK